MDAILIGVLLLLGIGATFALGERKRLSSALALSVLLLVSLLGISLAGLGRKGLGWDVSSWSR